MPSRLFAGLFARGAVADQTSDRALVLAMVDVELGLLRALVRTGLAPAAAADRLPDSSTLAASLDLDELGRSTGERGRRCRGWPSAIGPRWLPDARCSSRRHR